MFERVLALAGSTQFPNDEVGSPKNIVLEPGASPYWKSGCYVPSPCNPIDRLKAVAIGCGSIAIPIAGFVMSAFFAPNSLDMLRWWQRCSTASRKPPLASLRKIKAACSRAI